MNESELYKYAAEEFGIVSVTTTEGIITHANQRFCSISQYSEEELVGRPHSIINSGFHPAAFWSGFWRTITNGRTWRGEVCNKRKDGTYYWVDTTVIPLKNEEGEIEAFYSFRVDISKRKQREREAMFLANVVRKTNSGVLVANEYGEIEWVNEGFEMMTGYSLDEVAGKRPGEVLQGPGSSQEMVKYMRERVANRQSFYAELLNYRKDGTPFWVSIDCHPSQDQGSPLKLVAIQKDITERKEMALGLEESERRFREMANDSPVLIWVKDGEGNLTFANRSWREFVGAPEEGPILNFRSGVHPDDWEGLSKVVNRANNPENPHTYFYEYRLRHRNGTYRWVLEQGKPRFNAQGQLTGFIGSCTDTTELKTYQYELMTANTKLALSELRMTAFFKSSSDSNFLLDMNYKVVAFNRAAEKFIAAMYGERLKEGDSMLDYTSPESRGDFRKNFQGALKGEIVKSELSIRTAEGDQYYWKLSYYPARNRDGKIIGVAFNAHDISGLRKANLKLKRKNRRLEEIARLQSHDLRRPVASLLGLFSLFDPQHLSPEQKQVYDHMKTTVNEIDRVIKEVVQLTYDEDMDLPQIPNTPED